MADDDLRAGLGAALRILRAEAGLSQDELAYRAGINRSYLSDVERGVSSPSLDRVARLAIALNVRASELVRAAEKAVEEG